jgi:YjjI family glycine radical enzyme
MQSAELTSVIRNTIEDPSLTYRQRIQALAGLAENALEPPEMSDEVAAALDKRIICDMYEGNAPYRPRYLLPDYEKLLANGSAFLELPPADALDTALAHLLIAYTSTPSITGYPVYLGDFDKLLARFAVDVDDADLYRRMRLFWISLDRMFPDAFTHTNLGPDDSRLARLVLRLERELKQVVPNLSLHVDPERTPDDLILDAVKTVFECGQPHFVNEPMMVGDLGPRYAAVSCYNSLPVGGGSHTLVRLNLREAVLAHDGDAESFLAVTLPHYVGLTAELMSGRIRHLVEESKFYDHHWLVAEGLLSLDRFSAMFGVFGLAEASELLEERSGRFGKYGHDDSADATAYRITARLAELVAAVDLPYCTGNGGHPFLHSQSGIDTDEGVTAGTRIPIGTEPALHRHLRTVAPHHKFFAAGVSDILHFDETVERNPSAVVDIIRGAFAQGMRDFTFNLDSNDFIRVTGYLVRKSDLAKVAAEGVRHSSTVLGAGSVARSHVTDRAVKRVVSLESSPRVGR